ncbi:MAG: BolA family transcriptional regulator [Pelagibacterales bacterium]|nr:BolA family transcriptional regulator [Pelagibacterales bacterium]
MEERIIETLRKNLNIKFLEVKNNSYLHKGHLGDNGSGETHFAISIAAQELETLSLVNAHRKINQLLKIEFERGLHALEIIIKK